MPRRSTSKAASRRVRRSTAVASGSPESERVRRAFDDKLRGLRASGLELGDPVGDLVLDLTTSSFVQRYANGSLHFHDTIGTAFALHGPHLIAYEGLARRADLGHLITDVVPAAAPGVTKSVFARGGIYRSSAATAIPVTGDIYLAYELIGESKAIGAPTGPARAIPGGSEQPFARGVIFARTGAPAAHEVHGAILAAYRAAGGPTKLGFPNSDETDVRSGNTVIGRMSDFERAAIYWKSGLGAFPVAGDFLTKYRQVGGPSGPLGFPVGTETTARGVAGTVRAQRFQNGTLIWTGSVLTMTVVRPIRLFIGRINTDDEDGLGAGANDIYTKVKVLVGGRTVYEQRVPSSGDWSTGSNIVDVKLQIPVDLHPQPQETVVLVVDVWDSDPGSDDHLGKWTHTLTAADGWGLATSGGKFTSGSFSRINSISAAHQPLANVDLLSDVELFWGAKNLKTASISYQQYASAFRDVDNAPDWWSTSDWLDRTFYELVVEGLADEGNCFGMALEAIYSRKGLSLYSQPLSRFSPFSSFEKDVNIRHCYQVGALPIWWFVGQFLSGNTHDPVDVFRNTRRAFDRGDHPVLCLSQNYDFSGAPHCVLPIRWDDTVKPWRIAISDPNAPQEVRTLTVNPDDNTFEYVGASSSYRGGAWSGGRLHYMPFSVLCTEPRTPVWDAILLLLAGTVVILGADAETTTLTDLSGADIRAAGERARAELQAGRRLDGYFVPFNGFSADPSRQVQGELLLRAGPARAGAPGVLQASAGAGRVAARKAAAAGAPAETGFRHLTSARRAGAFGYVLKHGLSEYRVRSDLQIGDATQIEAAALGTGVPTLGLRPSRERLLRLDVAQKLGAGRDRVLVKIDRLAASAANTLEVRARPGTGDIDILPGAQPIDTEVDIETTIEDVTIARRFGVRVEGGTRLRLDQVMSEGVLSVHRIENLGGPAQATASVESHS